MFLLYLFYTDTTSLFVFLVIVFHLFKDVTSTGEMLLSLAMLGSNSHKPRAATILYCANTYFGNGNFYNLIHLKDRNFHSRYLFFDDETDTIYVLRKFRIEVCASLLRSKHKSTQILRLVRKLSDILNLERYHATP